MERSNVEKMLRKRAREGKPLRDIYRLVRLYLPAFWYKYSDSDEGLDTVCELLQRGDFDWSQSSQIVIGGREISVQTPADKAVGHCIRWLLSSYYEEIFLPCSHGFRKRRGPKTAIGAIREWDVGPGKILVHRDIVNCFPSIKAHVVHELLARNVLDDRLVYLITNHCNNGLPVGSTLSPLLCNIVLHYIDISMVALSDSYLRYADNLLYVVKEGCDSFTGDITTSILGCSDTDESIRFLGCLLTVRDGRVNINRQPGYNHDLLPYYDSINVQ